MLLPKRVWKDIPGYEGLYQVSNTGQVRSLNYLGTKGYYKILKQETIKDGYKRIRLYKDTIGKKYLVHRLVALTFIPNPNNYPIVNHKDEDKANNVVWNLEWCDYSYNTTYGSCSQKRRENLLGKNKGKNSALYGTRNKTRATAVLMFTLDGQFIRRFDSIADANEFMSKPRTANGIYACCMNKQNTAYGYIWKYEQEAQQYIEDNK